MAKYKLADWENNSYHDSYGQLLYFDTDTNKIHQIEHWSTAYPGRADMSEFLMPTVEIVEKAQKILADFYFEKASRIFASIKYRPTKEEVEKTEYVFLNCDFKGRKQGFVAKGTRCKVLRVKLSQFAPPRYGKGNYKSDYNVELLTPEGKKVWIRMDKLTLDWECPTEKQTMDKAIEDAKSCQFQEMSNCAWLDNNWALEVYKNSAEYKKAL